MIHQKFFHPLWRCARSWSSSSITAVGDRDAVIVAAKRTPVGSFLGPLSQMSAPQLGGIAIRAALDVSGVEDNCVEELLMGNVLSANVGQAPARQALRAANLGWSIPCTTVNRVCSSGMKTIVFSALSVQAGYRDVVVAGGMESMSNAPFYLGSMRVGNKLGHASAVDALLRDGLWDTFDDHHMGMCAEACAEEMSITREQQDEFAVESYERAINAAKAGRFTDEIVPVTIQQKQGKDPIVISVDDEPNKVKFDKMPTLRPAFKQDGTVTAANASKLNDGASAVVITSGKFAKERGLKPLGRILGMADAAQEPIKFPSAPSLAVPLALRQAGITAEQIDLYEINEAFSVVAIANRQLLGIKPEQLNVNGGAVSLGHPIGSSGCRIVVTLLHALAQNNGTLGVAAICNGGGGGLAMVIERL